MIVRNLFLQVVGLSALYAAVESAARFHPASADDETPTRARQPQAEPSTGPADLSLSFAGKTAGQERSDNSLKMKFVWCPPGAFLMGEIARRTGQPTGPNDNPVEKAPVEKDTVQKDKDDLEPPAEATFETTVEVVPPGERITPVKVFLRRGFWLGKYEVTQREWKQVMESEPWNVEDGVREGSDYPATYVSWNDAMAFCRKLTERERSDRRLPNGWEYTLPTEAQWERACRARTETAFSFGDQELQLDRYAWFKGTAVDADEPYPHPVGKKQANPWGLHDMHGNVWEWCRDVYTQKLPGQFDPEVTIGGSDRAARGGCWIDPAAACRSALRGRLERTTHNRYIGFRVACCPILHKFD